MLCVFCQPLLILWALVVLESSRPTPSSLTGSAKVFHPYVYAAYPGHRPFHPTHRLLATYLGLSQYQDRHSLRLFEGAWMIDLGSGENKGVNRAARTVKEIRKKIDHTTNTFVTPLTGTIPFLSPKNATFGSLRVYEPSHANNKNMGKPT